MVGVPSLLCLAWHPESIARFADAMLAPIWDAHVTVSTERVEAVRARLTHDPTCEDLMAVMTAHPSARGRDRVVLVDIPTVAPDPVAAAINDGVTLARSLPMSPQEESSKAGPATARSQSIS